MTPGWIPLHNPFLLALSAQGTGRGQSVLCVFHPADGALPPTHHR